MYFFCIEGHCSMIFIMFTLMIYYMILSCINLNIVNNQRYYRIEVISENSYFMSYCILLTCPGLFTLFFYMICKIYEREICQDLRIVNLLKTKKFLAEENTFLKEKYDLPVHLKRVCVNHLIKEEYNCPICLDEVSIDSSVYLTVCGHLFHNNCIDESLEYSKKCPTCRKMIVYNDEDVD